MRSILGACCTTPCVGTSIISIVNATVSLEHMHATHILHLQEPDVAMPASLMQVAQKQENQKHKFYEEEMEQAKVATFK